MIKLPLPAKAQYQLNTLTTNKLSTLNLKIGLQLNADIIQIAPDRKSIQFTIAQQKIAAFIDIKSPKSKQQLAQLKTGESIKLIVSKLQPQTELKILLDQPTNNLSKNTPRPPSIINNKNLTFILKPTASLTPTTQNNKSTLSPTPPVSLLLQTPKNTKYTALLANLNNQQQLNASIIQVNAKKITVQLIIPVKPNVITKSRSTKLTPINPDVITNNRSTNSTSVKPDTITNTKPTKLITAKPDVITNNSSTNSTAVKPDTITNTKPTKLITAKPDVITNNSSINLTAIKPDPIKNTKPTNQSQLNTPLTVSIKPSQPNSNRPIPITQTTYKALILNFPLPTKNLLSQQLTLTSQQAITLQVVKTGAEPQFKILPPPTTEETINTALRELLPKDQPSQTLIQQLSRDLPAIVRHEQVSDTLKRLAQEILKNLPSKQQVTEGKQLKNALDNNGTYLEAKLVQTFTEPNPIKLNTDFKANLLKLIQILQQNQTPKEADTTENETIKTLLKELQTKTEGALARLMLNQLKSLPQEDSNKQVWVIDLPFIEKKEKATSVKIQIEENHKEADNSEHTSWSATLTLTPPNMQTLHCKISYLNQAVHTNFWSEYQQTTQLIQNNLDYLSQRLQQAGLTPGNMSTKQQKQSSERGFSLDNKPLFDDNA